METAELKIECELLKRTDRIWIMGAISVYVLCYLFTRFLIPSYTKRGKLIYEGLLNQFNLGECIPAAHLLHFGMLLLAPFAIYRILTYSLIIKGTIAIKEDVIEITRHKQFKSTFKITDIQNLQVQFNYFKKNDIEPRSLVTGSNNIIAFRRFYQKYQYEFLLQTEEEDDTFRAIMDKWESNNVSFEYRTVLSDF